MAELRAVLCGDPHVKDKDHPDVTILEEDCARVIDEWHPDIFVCMGDLCDAHDKVKMISHKRGVQFMQQMSRRVPSVLLLGNHDRPPHQKFDFEDHYFTGVERPGVLDIVDRPRFYTHRKGAFTWNLGCIPYLPTGTLHSTLQTMGLDFSQVHASFGHQEIHGCDRHASTNYKPSLSVKGDRWPQDWGPLFSGHIHKRQTLGNVYYVGTPRQETFEEDTNKGICRLILRLPEGATYGVPEIDYVPTRIPPKLTFNLTPEEFYNFQAPENCKSRVIVKGKTSEVRVLEQMPQFKALSQKCQVLTEGISEQKVSGPTVAGKPDYWEYVNSKLNPDQQQMLASIPK